jgi:3-oxoacyl-[acyl-carrier-protein] synthase-3
MTPKECFIVGSGMYVPDTVIDNATIAPVLGILPEQIYRSSGIHRRRWAGSGTPTSALACTALERAMGDAGIKTGDIDYLLFGTMTPDRYIPGSACSVQKALGMSEIPCLDIRAACCNALYGIQLARALITSGTASVVALCFAEIQSAWLDLSPKSATISMLFGDGASALIVSADQNAGALEILDILLATNGSYVDDLGIRSPGTAFPIDPGAADTAECDNSLPRMVGQSVILQASRRMTAACERVLERNGMTIGDIHWIAPHQANANLLLQLARNLRFREGSGIISVLDEYGNTGSASMGMALDVLRHSAGIRPNDYVLLPAFAAGFTWGAGLCRASTST